MKKFNITENDTVKFYGITLPKGAMYGEDAKGIWICIDYRIKRMRQVSHSHYTHLRDEMGAWHKVELSPAKYKPMLRLLRPKKRGHLTDSARDKLEQINAELDWVLAGQRRTSDGMIFLTETEHLEALRKLKAQKKALLNSTTSYKQDAHRMNWVSVLEDGETVDKILELVERYPDKCEITYNTKKKVVPGEIKRGAIFTREISVVSTADARRASGNPDGRGIKRYIPYERIVGGTSGSTPDDTYAIKIGYVDLEKLAEKQRADREAK